MTTDLLIAVTSPLAALNNRFTMDSPLVSYLCLLGSFLLVACFRLSYL